MVKVLTAKETSKTKLKEKMKKNDKIKMVANIRRKNGGKFKKDFQREKRNRYCLSKRERK